MINWGAVPLGRNLPFMFDSYAAATGASITMSGIAVADINVYKDVSMTQRSSTVGYALLDTDGIDIDGFTGIHGFSIDTNDNTDAGFFAAGSCYTVVVSAVTIDSQTVNFVAGTFFLIATPSVLGVMEVDVTHYGGTAGTFAAGRPEVNVNAIAANAITAASMNADASAEIADAVWDEDATAHQTQGTFGQAIGDPAADTDTIYALVTNIQASTTNLPSDPADASVIAGRFDTVDTNIAALPTAAANATAVLTTVMTESYAVDGAEATLAQAVYGIQQYNLDRDVSGTTMTVRKLDGTTAAMVLTLDSAATPTDVNRTA
jgi:hypothetical protein